mgnify:CR=1 FL=1|tara:strand:+ start:7037 stop:9850 length:2814 start_codon:yes stop_codon:yes gene_type:complete
MAISNTPANSNITENWLFEFSADNEHCVEFDGSADNISFGDVLGLYTSFTLEAWIKPDAYSGSSGEQVIVARGHDGSTAAKNTNWYMSLSNAGLKVFYEYGTGSNAAVTATTSAITANNWHHVAVSRNDNDSTFRYFVDGALITSSTASGVANDPSGGGDGLVTIGADYNGGNEFDGEIAHVRVWNIARTAGEINQSYNRMVDSTASGLVGYWKLNEGFGTTVYDSSTNSNTGTLNNATWSLNNFDERIHAFGLAFADTTISSNRFHGSVLSPSISIRDSIDIVQGTSSTSNISIETFDVNIDSRKLSEIIYNGPSDFHNKVVKVYARYGSESTLASCSQIFVGRLVNVTLNDQKIKLDIHSHRPWDKISIPQVQHEKYNIYEPVVYGSYNYSDAQSGAENDAAYGGVFPVPILYTDRNIITTLMPRSYTSGSNCYLHHYVGYDHFCSIRQEGTGTNLVETTITQNGVNILETPTDQRAIGYIRTNQSSFDFSGSVTYLTNPERATDFNLDTGAADTSTYATADINDIDDVRYLTVQTPNKQFAVTIIDAVKIKYSIQWDDGSGDDQQYEVDFFSNEYDSTADDLLSTPSTKLIGSGISTHEFSFNTQPANSIASENALLCPDELLIKWKAEHNAPLYDHEDHELRVYDIQLRYENRFNYNDDDAKRLADLDYFYCGAAGLTASWDSGAISHGHDAHRDLLQRFGGISSSDPDNWSALDTDRAIDAWKIRFWALEPTSLQALLDKIAYEFCFVYKISPATGNLKYIYVKQSSELSASLDLSKKDLINIQLQTTGLSSVLVDATVNNKLHPAEANRYYATQNITDNTKRVKYNLGEKEGKEEFNLDYNVGTIPSSANSDCNADWYSYQSNLRDDMKAIITADVVNPAKGYQLETGDIVTFSDMPIEIFGTDFSASKFFMITQTNRRIGKVSITAREIA